MIQHGGVNVVLIFNGDGQLLPSRDSIGHVYILAHSNVLLPYFTARDADTSGVSKRLVEDFLTRTYPGIPISDLSCYGGAGYAAAGERTIGRFVISSNNALISHVVLADFGLADPIPIWNSDAYWAAANELR